MSRVFGAPGKAMMAGGYLVLDPEYSAYVTALSSRMHARVASADGPLAITVSSPQFDGHWRYAVAANVATESEGRHNPFLHAAVQTVLNYVQPATVPAIEITLFLDPGYHTQENTSERRSANGKRAFLYHGRPIERVAKTGMGLSAGLVAVVTTALLCTLLDKPPGELRRVIHNVAQIAHCDAQGKIGSGFDVAAAVYGSIVYRRFPPSTINHLLGQPPTPALCAAVRKTADAEWDMVHTQCSVPPGLRLLMGDVNGGSETPKLVLQVLAWRQADPHSGELYAQLNAANESFMRALAALLALHADNAAEYANGVRNGTLFGPVARAIAAIRTALQELTRRSGADIEPAPQTALLDKCAALPGCLGGVVPGAGGYDAVCLLVEEAKVGELKRASAADAAFASVTWLDLSEEAEGLLEEPAADYAGL